MAEGNLYPPLRVEPGEPKGRTKKKPWGKKPEAFDRARQINRFEPKFNRLKVVLNRDPSGLELHTDPAGLAPERLLVMESREYIEGLASAIKRVAGLELIDEEEIPTSEDGHSVAYILFPDVGALKELCSLWERWKRKGKFPRGFAPWKQLFELLIDLRPWGPRDRLSDSERHLLQQEIEERQPGDRMRLELELVFRESESAAQTRQEVERLVRDSGGKVIARSRIDEIAYDALLVDLPVEAVRDILDDENIKETLAWADPVMHIRPQATVDRVPTEPESDYEPAPEDAPPEPCSEPILALLDGVPVSQHPVLVRHLVVGDLFGLEGKTLVSDREHGTAMASLIVRGDLNRSEPFLPRKILHVPVMGAHERFPDDRLVVDMFYTAVRRMVGSSPGEEPLARDVLIINVSLGNSKRIFQGAMSPWARLLDRLSWEHGLLFVVSGGNHAEPFELSECATLADLEQKSDLDRSRTVLRSIDAKKAERRLFAPAEGINALTVGAWNHDDVPSQQRRQTRMSLDPYPGLRMVNPSSALGPGFARSVKPDVVAPGGREQLRPRATNPGLHVRPAPASRCAGLKVPNPSSPSKEGYTGGTSAAAALVSRLAHRIHDVLEQTYGQTFLSLSKHHRAALLKAFIVHASRWPDDGADLIATTIGPADRRKHVARRDNVLRYFGYGIVDFSRAISCASDRATFWAVGEIGRETEIPVSVPVPTCIGGRAQPHMIAATLAWLTPVKYGTYRYRGVRLRLLRIQDPKELGVDSHPLQPEANQAHRGTVVHRRWYGEKAPAVSADDWLELVVQRGPDPLDLEPAPIPFALVVTIEMPGVNKIYEEVRQRLQMLVQARIEGVY